MCEEVVLGKFQAACIPKITVELTTFLPCILMSETEYNAKNTFSGEACHQTTQQAGWLHSY